MYVNFVNICIIDILACVVWKRYNAFHMHRVGVSSWHERNENDAFLTFGLGMFEGVDEDSRHGIGHVDIQVGSCICLNAFVLNHCIALRWGVTQVG